MDVPEYLVKTSNAALGETLTTAFQNLRLTRAPKAKLSKFCGPPKKSGDMTLVEWIEEFDMYARQLGLNEQEQVGRPLTIWGALLKTRFFLVLQRKGTLSVI